MASSTGGGWAQLRQQTRQLETQTETLFHTYSQYAQTPSIPAEPTQQQLTTESQISDLFTKRESLISQLARLLDSESAMSKSALKQSNLARHREVLANHKNEFRNLQSTLNSSRQRANLLGSVRDDINAYHASGPDADAEYMLGERDRIENSHNMTDSVLSQAYAVQEQFGIQRETLLSVQRRIQGAAAVVPGLNSLMNKISARKRRDGLILGTFMAFVCLMFLYFL